MFLMELLKEGTCPLLNTQGAHNTPHPRTPGVNSQRLQERGLSPSISLFPAPPPGLGRQLPRGT